MTSDPFQTHVDVMDPARARALQATLGEAPSITSGDPLPPFAHHIYFWDPQPPQALGRDGHPATGDLIPDMGTTRRMWAAGKLTFHRPLLAGIRAEKITRVENLTRKTGRSGPLAFVRLRHDIRQRQTLALTEYQELVYRPEAGKTPLTPPDAPTGETHSQDINFDPTLLFRYSSLTFNGHRIHYDQPYATGTEGYGGLIVHGPLLAHLLMGLAARQLGTLKAFTYRATSPLTVDEAATLCWKNDGSLWVRGPDGRLCMQACAA